MILTVTLNAALDVTYEVDALVPYTSHRVRGVRERAGGKGVNVASVLQALGLPVTATGLLGGSSGARIAADLDARMVDHHFFRCAGESRRTVTVVSAEEADATIFNEPGPDVTTTEWSAVVHGIPRLLERTRAAVLVLSGSLPPGAPEDGYAELVALGRACGARTVVDADGSALLLAVAAGPDVVKPNLAELIAATGTTDPLAGAAALRVAGAGAVVVSAGADGLVAVPRDGARLRCRLRTPVSGNPTGAGDAVVAALAAGLAEGRDWPTMTRNAVAWSAAAVLQPVAGMVDPSDVDRLVADVHLERDAEMGRR